MSSIGEAVGVIELIQSMRVGTFGDFVVLGSQYRDEAGDRHWYVVDAEWSESRRVPSRPLPGNPPVERLEPASSLKRLRPGASTKGCSMQRWPESQTHLPCQMTLARFLNTQRTTELPDGPVLVVNADKALRDRLSIRATV